ncbi:MAG: hypothetical protein JSU83_04890 [Deltaproteobacteria bacterium]|nr:MAG: hypothetical protein JSU83_04890 [Deltaproteobacteria bacterium]
MGSNDYMYQELKKVKNLLVAVMILLPIGIGGTAFAYRDLGSKFAIYFETIAFLGYGLIGYSIERIYNCLFYADATQ